MSYPLTKQQLNDARALAFRVLQSLPQKLDTTHFSKEAWLARAVIDLGDKLAEREAFTSPERLRRLQDDQPFTVDPEQYM